MSILRFLGGAARAASLLAFASAAWAQQPLGLQDAQRIALARSQQLVAHDAAAAAAREQSVSAAQLPDPVLKAGIENLPVNGPDRFSLSRDFMTMRSIGLMQEFTRADKRRLRAERFQRDGERIQAERLEATATIQRETALAWIERHYAQAMVTLLRRQLQEAQLEVQAAEIAYANARGTQAELFGSRAAAVQLQDRLRQAERQVRAAGLALARWVGADAASRPPDGRIDWRDPTAAASLSPDHLQHLPHLAVLAAQVRAAETEVQQAQANTRPDWTVEAMFSQRGSAYSNMVSIGVSVPLQIGRTNRQDREVAAKLAALAEARAKYEDAFRMHEAEVRMLANDWNSGKERHAQLQAALLPAARMRSAAALTAYQAGTGPLAAVLAARREEIDAGMQLLALEMETARLWAQLHYLTPEAAPLPVPKEQP
ncbi:TolC family protein [Caenimonas sedimenti]|uniref:TolC family protein n=1 Tax=Caenimonas sedimenti TaxID=2596921 RepID=A0A562ZE47_9BURK|nr:TolC family protein [Caenimonas sedimenti]TWO64431.1 TolC family protein [Caenimonas sedimenti]